MTPTTDKTTASFVEALVQQSDADAATTPMDAVVKTARTGKLTDDQCFRLLARLWILKRMMYYIYGGWAQCINLNEYPPAVAYLFGRQTYDESTTRDAQIAACAMSCAAKSTSTPSLSRRHPSIFWKSTSAAYTRSVRSA
jgi:hypothetical protein